MSFYLLVYWQIRHLIHFPLSIYTNPLPTCYVGSTTCDLQFTTCVETRHALSLHFTFRHIYIPALIIFANVDGTSLDIGKTNNPFQLVIMPALFVFYVLVFGHELKVIAKTETATCIETTPECSLTNLLKMARSFS